MQLTIHRGTHEIGGSCVELTTARTRILIDLGLPLDYDQRSEEEQQRIHNEASAWCVGADALFLSHAHSDHYGLMQRLPAGTPLYLSLDTRRILALDAILGQDACSEYDIRILQIGQPIEVGDIRVTAFTVDHSAYGASAFLFEADGKRIVYSGDIRLTGRKGVLYKLLPQGVDYLLLEGTNIAANKPNITERTLEKHFEAEFRKAPDALHLVWASSKNIDRICSLFRAVKRSGKILALDPFAANILRIVSGFNPHIPSVTTSEMMVYFPHRITERLMKKNAEEYIYSLRPQENKLTLDELAAHPERYVLMMRPGVLDFLNKLSAPRIRLITSIWHEYWQTIPEPFRQWVEERCEVTEDIHTSGHADVRSLQKIVSHIRPEVIIPMHTEHPECFAESFPKHTVRLATDNEAIIL